MLLLDYKGKDLPLNLFWVSIFLHHKEENFIMKLKKIVSLALAGIMAVSMLAGCSGNSNSGNTQEPTTPATGISAKVDGMLDQKDKIELTDNSTYASYLASAIEKADLKAGDLLDVTTMNWATTGTVVTELQNSFKYNVVNYVTTQTVASFSKPTTADEKVYMSLFVAPGAKSEDVVLNALVAKLDSVLTKDNLPKTITVGTDYYNEKYTGSVSMQKVTDGSTSAWYILVTIENEASKV